MALLLYFTYSFLKTLAIHSQGIFGKKIYFFIVNLGVLDLEFFTKLQNFGVLRMLVKVFEYGYISVIINDTAFIFDIQLAKDLGNIFPWYFCKKKYFFNVNLGVLDLEFFTKLQNFGVLRMLVKLFEYGYMSVTINGTAFIFDIQLAKNLGNTIPGYFCKKKYFFTVNLGVLDLECFYQI